MKVHDSNESYEIYYFLVLWNLKNGIPEQKKNHYMHTYICYKTKFESTYMY